MKKKKFRAWSMGRQSNDFQRTDIHLFIDSINISWELIKHRNDAQYFHMDNDRQFLISGRQNFVSIVVKWSWSEIMWRCQGRLLKGTLESAQQGRVHGKKGWGCWRERGLFETSCIVPEQKHMWGAGKMDKSWQKSNLSRMSYWEV